MGKLLKAFVKIILKFLQAVWIKQDDTKLINKNQLWMFIIPNFKAEFSTPKVCFGLRSTTTLFISLQHIFLKNVTVKIDHSLTGHIFGEKLMLLLRGHYQKYLSPSQALRDDMTSKKQEEV